MAFAKGFDAYIEKPFEFELLYRILRKHINKQNQINKKKLLAGGQKFT